MTDSFTLILYNFLTKLFERKQHFFSSISLERFFKQKPDSGKNIVRIIIEILKRLLKFLLDQHIKNTRSIFHSSFY